MRVGLDLTALQPLETGVDVYLGGLFRSLVESPGGHDYLFFVNREDVASFRGLPPCFRVVPAASRSRWSRLFFQQLRLPMAVRSLGIDVLHSPAFVMPLLRGRARHVLTVYDLTILTMPENHDRLHRSRAFRQALRWSIARADRICVPTGAVAGELAAAFPRVADRVRVVRPGLGAGIVRQPPAEVSAVTRRLGLERPYILYVGTLEPRKNLRRLVAAFRRLLAAGIEADLVLAGRLGWDMSDLLADLAQPGLAGRVHRLGFVPATDLAALYSGARLFVYPSLAEGFGFPPLEAMACGVPVVASRDAALVENLAGAAELVDALATPELADALSRVWNDRSLAAQMSERGAVVAARFSWQETARATLSCYEELAPQRASEATGRPRSAGAETVGGAS